LLEGEEGGIFHYLSRLEKEAANDAAAAASNVVSASSPTINQDRFQHGELGQVGGLGAFLHSGDKKGESTREPSNRTKSVGKSRRAMVPSQHVGVFESSNATSPGQGLASFMADYTGEQQDFQRRLHPSVTRKRESALGSLGVHHPGEVGILPEDPSLINQVRAHHERDIQAQKNSVEFTEEEEGGGEGGVERALQNELNELNSLRKLERGRRSHGSHLLNASSENLAHVLDSSRGKEQDEKVIIPVRVVTPHNGGALSDAGGLGVFVGTPPSSTTFKANKNKAESAIQNEENAKKNVIDKVGLLLVSDAERLRLEDEAITREIQALDNARKEKETGSSSSSSSSSSPSPYSSASSLLAAQEATRRALFGADGIGLGPRVTPGKASRIAASAAASGLVKVPIENSRLLAVRKALRDRLPKDPRAAALALRHKLSALDGDRDGVLEDEELLGALMDLAPSNLTASDLGHAARLIKGTEAARLRTSQEELDASEIESVPILSTNEVENEETLTSRWGLRGVSSDSVINWVLGLKGGVDPLNSSGWNPITRSTMGVQKEIETTTSTKEEKEESNETSEGTDNDNEESRFSFSSKNGSYSIWRAKWEEKHGAPARKERELDNLVPPDGPTWTRADPVAFKVLHLIQGSPAKR